MAKVFDFQWQIPVPEFLLQGACFDRWEEVRSELFSLYIKDERICYTP